VISRYPEVIWLSLRQIADSDRRPTDFACPILSPKKQLWDIPKRRESFTSRSAEVTRNRPVGRILQALKTKYDFKILLRKQKRVTKLEGLNLKFKNYCTNKFLWPQLKHRIKLPSTIQ